MMMRLTAGVVLVAILIIGEVKYRRYKREWDDGGGWFYE